MQDGLDERETYQRDKLWRSHGSTAMRQYIIRLTDGMRTEK